MGATPHAACPQAARTEAILAMLARDDLDAAIDAGLMDLVPCAPDCACTPRWTPIADAQRRLRAAWDARDRHRARQARLARRAAERDARRAPAPAAPSARPALPPSAAAILARAKARAAGHKASE